MPPSKPSNIPRINSSSKYAITVQRLVPETQTTEAFGIYTAFIGVGYALAGAALAALSLHAA